jgi:hypothetical protein
MVTINHCQDRKLTAKLVRILKVLTFPGIKTNHVCHLKIRYKYEFNKVLMFLLLRLGLQFTQGFDTLFSAASTDFSYLY